MAYSSTNPAAQIVSRFTGTGSVYIYSSTHAHADIEAANFFTGCGFGSPHANAIGLQIGDLVCNVNVSTAGSSAITWHRVSSLSTSTGWNSPIHATVSAAST